MDERIVPNAAPIASNVAISVHAGNASALSADATDADNDPIEITSVSTPYNGTVAFTASTVTFTPNAGFVGSEILFYTVGDGQGNFDTAMMTFTLTNTPPTAANYDVYVHAGNPATVTPTLSDSDDDTVTITGVGTSTHGTVSLNDGVITFTPASNFVGDATFTYTVSDGNSNGTVAGTITVHVLNQPPVPLNYSFTAHAGNTVVIMPDMLVDPDGDYTFISGVGTPVHGTVTVDEEGAIYFTPTAGYTGTETFDYELSDEYSATGTGYITLTFTNTPPTITTPETQTIDEDTAAIIEVTASDADDDDLSIVIITAPEHGTLVIDGMNLIYTPDENWNGTDTYEILVTDGLDTSSIVTGTIVVNSVNDLPIQTEFEYVIEMGGELNIAPMLADADNDVTTVTSISGPTYGSVTQLSDGSFQYTPATETWLGTDSFTYVVSDGNGGFVTNTVVIEVTEDGEWAAGEEAEPENETPIAKFDRLNGAFLTTLNEYNDAFKAASTSLAQSRFAAGAIVTLNLNLLLVGNDPIAAGAIQGQIDFYQNQKTISDLSYANVLPQAARLWVQSCDAYGNASNAYNELTQTQQSVRVAPSISETMEPSPTNIGDRATAIMKGFRPIQ